MMLHEIERGWGRRPASRSRKFAACALLYVLLLIVCRGDESTTVVLNLLCWTEYVPASVTQGFTEQSGVRVVMENYNSNEQMLAMLRDKPNHYDLVQPSQAYVETLIRSGGLEALNPERIPNLRNVDPQFRGMPHDPENRFSVPWMSGTVGIVVNTRVVKEPIRTWADVFSGKYRGRIVAVNDPREMVAWALASLAMPITNIDGASLARVEPVLRQWLPQIAVFDSDSPHLAMLDGRADIGIVWSGEAALLWQRDHQFRYVLPKEGAHMFLDSLAIPKGAPHKDAAEEFVNYCLEPQVSALISKEYPYTNPNLAARKLLSPEALANPASYPHVEERLWPLRNVGNDTKAVDAFVRKIRQEIGKQ